MLTILHFADAHIDMANYGRHDPAQRFAFACAGFPEVAGYDRGDRHRQRRLTWCCSPGMPTRTAIPPPRSSGSGESASCASPGGHPNPAAGGKPRYLACPGSGPYPRPIRYPGSAQCARAGSTRLSRSS